MTNRIGHLLISKSYPFSFSGDEEVLMPEQASLPAALKKGILHPAAPVKHEITITIPGPNDVNLEEEAQRFGELTASMEYRQAEQHVNKCEQYVEFIMNRAHEAKYLPLAGSIYMIQKRQAGYRYLPCRYVEK